jgi:hypothetical protein
MNPEEQFSVSVVCLLLSSESGAKERSMVLRSR